MFFESQEKKSGGNEEIAAEVQKQIAILKSGDDSARVNAIILLAEFGSEAETAVPALIDMLKNFQWIVRVSAITALGEIGRAAKNAVPALIEKLNEEDVRSSTIIALERIGPEAREALPTLKEFFQNESEFVRQCSEEAVRAIEKKSD